MVIGLFKYTANAVLYTCEMAYIRLNVAGGWSIYSTWLLYNTGSDKHLSKSIFRLNPAYTNSPNSATTILVNTVRISLYNNI